MRESRSPRSIGQDLPRIVTSLQTTALRVAVRDGEVASRVVPGMEVALSVSPAAARDNGRSAADGPDGSDPSVAQVPDDHDAAGLIQAAGLMPDRTVEGAGIGLLADAGTTVTDAGQDDATCRDARRPVDGEDDGRCGVIWSAGGQGGFGLAAGAAALGAIVLGGLLARDDSDGNRVAAPVAATQESEPTPAGNGNEVTVVNKAPVGADENVAAPNSNWTSLNDLGITLAYTDAEGDAVSGIKVTGFSLADYDYTIGRNSDGTRDVTDFAKIDGKIYALVTRIEDGNPLLGIHHPLDWDTARAAAIDLGGHLATFETAAEINAVLSAYNGFFAGQEIAVLNGTPVYAEGGNADATFIGLQQQDTATTPVADWFWTSGSAYTLDAVGWFGSEPNDADGNEDGAEQLGALIDGAIGANANLIIDHANVTTSRYLVEFESPLLYADGTAVMVGDVIDMADAGGLRWNPLILSMGDPSSFSYQLVSETGTQQTASYTVTLQPEIIWGFQPDDPTRVA